MGIGAECASVERRSLESLLSFIDAYGGLMHAAQMSLHGSVQRPLSNNNEI